MKTKIIYISGSEVFEMSDVRAAFDEVRNALGLGRDTVLFGVPVDNDDALSQAAPAAKAPEIEDVAPVVIEEPTEIISEPESEPAPAEPEEIIIPEQEIVIEEPIAEVAPVVEEAPAPVKKSRGRPRKTAPKAEVTGDAPAAMPADGVTAAPQSEKVIPILSVLAAKAPVAEAAPDIASDAAPAVAEEDPAEIAAVADEQAQDVADEPAADLANDDTAIESVSIDDMIADQAPEEPIEKTLEQLLESMTPLREDHGEAAIADAADDIAPAIDMTDDEPIPVGDADATLEQLAAEFANTEDKIAAPAPTQSQGKIGKLKNILPFKKARREDTGLMGDLFGWAGVAANDEDFTIPGFFTTAAKK